MKSLESKYNFFGYLTARYLYDFYRGPFSVVRRCTNKADNKQYAVKIIDVEQFIATLGFSADGTELSFVIITRIFFFVVFIFLIQIFDVKQVFVRFLNIHISSNYMKHLNQRDAFLWFSNSAFFDNFI